MHSCSFIGQAEALRLWSIFAQHNIPMHLSLDDVYPSLCHLFLVPQPATICRAGPAPGPAAERAAELEAALASAALETAAALAGHSVRSGILFILGQHMCLIRLSPCACMMGLGWQTMKIVSQAVYHGRICRLFFVSPELGTTEVPDWAGRLTAL